MSQPCLSARYAAATAGLSIFDDERVDGRRHPRVVGFGELGDGLAPPSALDDAVATGLCGHHDDRLQKAEVADQLAQLGARRGLLESVDQVEREVLAAQLRRHRGQQGQLATHFSTSTTGTPAPAARSMVLT